MRIPLINGCVSSRQFFHAQPCLWLAAILKIVLFDQSIQFTNIFGVPRNRYFYFSHTPPLSKVFRYIIPGKKQSNYFRYNRAAAALWHEENFIFRGPSDHAACASASSGHTRRTSRPHSSRASAWHWSVPIQVLPAVTVNSFDL